MSLPTRHLLAVFLLMTSPLAAFADEASPVLNPDAAKPPETAMHPKTVGLHGDKIDDPYFWLRDKANPAVLDHLKAENTYTAAVMEPFKSFEDGVYKEMLGRIKQADTSAPYLQRGYWLYQRTEEGKQYPILCRKKGTLEAPEEIVLDVNKLAEGQKFMALGTFEYNDENTLLAYSTDINGHRDYDFHLKNLVTGEEIQTPVGKVAEIAWATGRTLFFATEDESKRHDKVWRYTVGDNTPTLVYEEKDELFDVGVGRTLDDQYMMIGSESKRTTEFLCAPASQPKAGFRVIAPRRNEIEYYPEHRGDLFYIRTNDGAKEFRVVVAPEASPDPGNWHEFLPARPGVKIEDFQPYAKHAVVTTRENALTKFQVYDFATRETKSIPLPEAAYDANADHNAEFETAVFRFNYQSPVTPPSIYDYDIASGKQTLLKQTEVQGGYDPARYTVERVEAPAADGTKIPLDIIRRKDVAVDGKAPCWLYGYGSYGISIDPSFSSTRLSLLERGVIYAIAHIRGGGELGEAWHEGGRMMTKKNTFTDFVACADYLADHQYTTHDKMVIEGGSAGGLLIGATLNLRPDLCKAAVLAVPFVDVLNTMSDPSLPLTTSEYIEWGNPNNKDEYTYIKSYSPYDNLKPASYPDILVLTSLNDSQVPYWEPAKYTAKLRTLKTDHNPLLFKINLDAGHGGASGRFDRLHEVAFEYTFGLAALGLAK